MQSMLQRLQDFHSCVHVEIDWVLQWIINNLLLTILFADKDVSEVSDSLVSLKLGTRST